MSSVDRYAELCAKVDAFFESVTARYSSAMHCESGCSECCNNRFSITPVEARVIEQLLEAADPELRRRLAERAERGDPAVCAALDDGGRCEIYDARPLVCRSHGVPIRARPDRVSLPVVTACRLNFDGDVSVADVADDAVLDQETLSTVLMAVDLAHSQETGTPRGQRVDLAELLSRYSV